MGMGAIEETEKLLTTRTKEDIAAEEHREASALTTRLGHESVYEQRLARKAELEGQMLSGSEIDNLRTVGLFADLSSALLDPSRDPDKYKDVITGITGRDKTIREDIAEQTKEISALLDSGMIDLNTAQEAYRDVETKRLQEIADLPRTAALDFMKSQVELLRERHRGTISLATAQKDYEAAINAAVVTAANYRHDPAMQKQFEELINDARTKGPGKWKNEPEGSENKKEYDAWQAWIIESETRYYTSMISASYLGEGGPPIKSIRREMGAPGIVGLSGVGDGRGGAGELQTYLDELGQLSNQELVDKLMVDAKNLNTTQLRQVVSGLPEERRNMVLAEFARE